MNDLTRYEWRLRDIPLLFAITTVAIAVSVSGCATPNEGSPPPPANTSPEFVDEYRIGVGDSLHVNVWQHDDLSLTVPVRPDGRISVPLAGELIVGNKTPSEVGDSVTAALGEYIRDPIVTIIVTNMGSDQFRSRVRVTGAVTRPSSTPYRQGMTVLDAVLEAGGITEFANPGKAALFRSDGQRIPVNLDGILNKGDLSSNYGLNPGDVITVPERAF